MSIKRNYFGNPKLVDEKVLLLEKTTPFLSEIKEIRNTFSINLLDPEKDKTIVYYGGKEYDESIWFTKQPQIIQEKFENEVETLLIKYNLPLSFRDWIEKYILYGKPKTNPYINYELVHEIMKNPSELTRLPLSTGEKELVKDCVRYRLGIKKKPSKYLRKTYQELLDALSKSRNTTRSSRTTKTSIKTLKMGAKHTYFDFALGVSGKKVTHKTTSTDLATEIFNDETGTKAVLVRKQHQRLKERIVKLLKVK